MPSKHLQLALVVSCGETGVVGGLEPLGFDPGHAELEVVSERAVDEGFFEGLVAVFILDVLAHDADGDLGLRVVGAVDEIAPAGKVGLGSVHAEVLEGQGVHALLREVNGHLVDAGDVLGGDNGLLFDVAEGGDLVAHLARDVAVGAAKQDVGLDADREHLLHGVLGGLGFELLRGSDPGDQGDMDEEGVVAAEILAHLSDRFKEWKALDVAHRAADLDNGDVHVGRDLAHGVLDLVRNMRDDLDGLAEVVAAALLRDDLFVDAARGQVVVAAEVGVGEALVVAEVEVGFGAVVRDEDLAVLEGRHGSGVDVKVGVELHQVDAKTASLKETADGGCG